ncbi:hypothetical protein Leryth_007876 [Lithospermum erythrorhizon]|nr:hypothetical protein Leryth_007876 [Lithospermum erythrorhizon]
MVKLRMFEGELMNTTDHLITIQVDTHGGNHLVTWTLDCEKLNANVPDLVSLMELSCALRY